MAFRVRFACAAILLALGAPAFAQTKADEARAASLKKEGDALVHASKFKEALEKYDASFALVANPAIQYNRARAFESLGDYPAALDAFDKFVATAPESLKSRVPHLDQMIAGVASHVATLVIKCEVHGAKVTVRDKPLGDTPVAPMHTTPGDATVTVSAPGYVTFSETRTLAEGQTTEVDVTLHKAAAEATVAEREPTPFDKGTPSANDEPPPSEPKHEAPPSASGGHGLRTFAWIIGGVGLASVGAGMVFMGLSLSDKNAADPHCPNKVCDATGRQSINEAWTFATVSTVLVIVGAAALGTSLVSFIVSPKSAPVQARLFIGPGSAGLGGTF